MSVLGSASVARMTTQTVDRPVFAPAELLLISDDPHRAERLARDLGSCGTCRVHDLYDDAMPRVAPKLILSDVDTLSSNALLRLRRILDRMRGRAVPYLFLVHGNAARAEAQAMVLGASGTLDAGSLTYLLIDTVAHLQKAARPAYTGATRMAYEAKLFFQEFFFSGKPVTPALSDRGTELIVQAIQEVGIRDWVQVVQSYDDGTHQHCMLVAGLAAAFSGALGLNPADRHRLAKAALLHDVGKTLIPLAILNKPGKLDEAEMKVMRTHAALGHGMLSGSGFGDDMLHVVRSHHELLDGSGYPDKLKGGQISDLVRLVTICDIYGALIECRPYRQPMASEGAFRILDNMTGQLDADLVRAFHSVATKLDVVADVTVD